MTMPKPQLMTYLPGRKQWRRMERGRRYIVSVRQLGGTDKADTLDKANEWWEKQVAKMLLPSYVKILQEQRQYDIEMVEHCDQLIVAYQMLQDNAESLCPGIADLSRRPKTTGEIDKVRKMVKAYLDDVALRVQSGQLSAGSLTAYRLGAHAFLDWFVAGEEKPAISETTVREYYQFVSQSDCSRSSKIRMWNGFVAVLETGAELGLCSLPSNLRSRKYKFGSPDGNPQYWTVAEWQKTYRETSELGRLLLLLASNTGLYPSDMANLGTLDGNRLTHTRWKTKRRKIVRVFTLWDETLDLLRTHGHLLSGLWSSELVDGKVVKRTGYRKIVKHWTSNIKHLRHTSARFIEASEQWRSYKQAFLSHSDRSIADKHYASVQLPDGLFQYLRECYM